ncbi:MAG: hypothetical protein O2807_07030, partial [bacterium]|nr:hypothetical protein [bacterium]
MDAGRQEIRIWLGDNFSTKTRYIPQKETRWQFLVLEKMLVENTGKLRFGVNVSLGSGPVLVGGVFFSDGNRIVPLLGRNVQPPRNEIEGLSWKSGAGELPPGWRFDPNSPAKRIEVTEGVRPGVKTALRFKGKFQMIFPLSNYVGKAYLEGLKGKAFAVSAMTRAVGKDPAGRCMRLRVYDGVSHQATPSQVSDGNWRLMQLSGRVSPSAGELALILEADRQECLVWIDGIFFDDGRQVFNLLPIGLNAPRNGMEVFLMASRALDIGRTGASPPGWRISGKSRKELSFLGDKSSLGRGNALWFLPKGPLSMEFDIGNRLSLDPMSLSNVSLSGGVWVRHDRKLCTVSRVRFAVYDGRVSRGVVDELISSGEWLFVHFREVKLQKPTELVLKLVIPECARKVLIGPLFVSDGKVILQLLEGRFSSPPRNKIEGLSWKSGAGELPPGWRFDPDSPVKRIEVTEGVRPGVK